jgi:hypothetical protein
MSSFRDLAREERDRKKQEMRKERELTHGTQAAADPFDEEGRREVEVLSRALVIRPAKAVGKSHLVCEYRGRDDTGMPCTIRQWVCVEIPGGARWHAERWFRRRGYTDPVPRQAFQALAVAQTLPVPESLTVSFSGKWPEIVMEHWESKDTAE